MAVKKKQMRADATPGPGAGGARVRLVHSAEPASAPAEGEAAQKPAQTRGQAAREKPASRGAAATPKPAPRRVGALEMPLLTTAGFALIGYAWLQRNEGYITAETGLGYWLGIAGGLMMLALLVYPLRKRLPVLRALGEVKSWFRWHMILGFCGPVLVVIHSNFKLASLNGRVAMFSMLVVSSSGFIGRFLYARIHRGLYGRRMSVRECIDRLTPKKEALNLPADLQSEIREVLETYETARVERAKSLFRGLLRALTGPMSRRRLRRAVLARVALAQHDPNPTGTRAAGKPGAGGTDAEALIRQSAFREALDDYLEAVSRTERFALYERLFALWHVLHLPLFFILVLAASVHVLAVHLF